MQLFYEINGQKVYLEVDGKAIDSYFAKSLETEIEKP